MDYFTASPSQTKKLGEILAKKTLKTKLKKTAFIIGLEGDLGGGKTTFLKGFARGLGIKEKILSPTFIIVKRFQLNNLTIKPQRKASFLRGRQFNNFYHIDCYRIEKPKEILDLGFKKIILNSKNIVAIEWADKIKKIMPKNTTILKFEFIGKKNRKITIRNFK